jgi:hypothetical protein
MTRRAVWVVVCINLVALIGLVFLYPHLMVSPGAVVAAHQEIATDCFACHAPLRGASASRCVACHAVDSIGLRTSKGVAIAKKNIKGSFHQELLEQDCMACHSDHAGPKLSQKARKPFSHALLRTSVRDQCQTCHKAPDNKLHQKLTGSCQQCHSQNAWKPATLDHDKLFVLDGDHNAPCETCHINNNYSQYTCYGCHEHTVQNVLREHRDENIRNINNCVECHRSADDEGGGDD